MTRGGGRDADDEADAGERAGRAARTSAALAPPPAPSAMRMPTSRAPLRDDIGDDAVDADEPEQQRHAGGDAEDHQRERRLRHRLVVDLLQRPRPGQRQVGIDAPDRLLHLAEEAGGADARRADGIAHRALHEQRGSSQKSFITIGQYTVGGAGLVTPSSCVVADDADDLAPRCSSGCCGCGGRAPRRAAPELARESR